jgi:hypothetical protein
MSINLHRTPIHTGSEAHGTVVSDYVGFDWAQTRQQLTATPEETACWYQPPCSDCKRVGQGFIALLITLTVTEAATITDPHAAAHTNKTLQVEWIDPDSFYLYLYLCLFLTLLLSGLLMGNVHTQKIPTLKCFFEIFAGLVVFLYKLM